jgi:hypothetical protein
VSCLGEDIRATIVADSGLFSYQEATEILEMITVEFDVLASFLKKSDPNNAVRHTNSFRVSHGRA